MNKFRILGQPYTLGRPIGKKAFSPSDIAGLTHWVKSSEGLWKDAAKTQPATLNGDLIYTWANKVTGGTDFIQNDNAHKPSLAIVSGANFVSSNPTGSLGIVATIVAGTAQTLFVAIKKLGVATATTQVAFKLGATAQVWTKNTIHADGYVYATNEVAANVLFDAVVTDWNVISITYTDTSHASIRVNGGTPVDFDPADAYSTSVAFTVCGQVFNGHYLEVLRYSSALSDVDRAKVEAYLATRIANPT